ncbi:MAG TPA: hypothetical protein DCL44_04835 [Elusimicrobia bacterium]|nr:hypothetical protein [Elusimicrobiota bacterium]
MEPPAFALTQEAVVKLDGPVAKAGEVEKIFTDLGFFFCRVDCAGLGGKGEFITAVGTGFGFSGVDAHNWDSLEDSLGSLPCFRKAAGYAAVLSNFSGLPPGELALFEEVVRDAAAALWRNYSLRLKVVLLKPEKSSRK